MKIDDKLKEIIDDYISDYLDKRNDLGKIVSGTFPIIWFGNLEKYLSSNKKKIVTVAVNPSKGEFEERRFDDIHLDDYKVSSEEVKDRLRSDLADSLNEYFDGCNGKKPYWQWFKSYNRVLNHIGADYKNSLDSDFSVVHIDIYSAIATDPVWSKLPKDQKERLPNPDLFKKLMQYLEPDIVLYSSDEGVFPNLLIYLNSTLRDEEQIVFKKEYFIDKKIMNHKGNKIEEECRIGVNHDEQSIHSQNYLRIYSNPQKTKAVVWGKNIQLPFTVFNDKVRGEILKAWLKDHEIDDDLSYVRIKKEKQCDANNKSLGQTE